MDFDSHARTALDSCFAVLGAAAIYRPRGGNETALIAIRSRGEQVLPGLGGGRQLHAGAVLDVRASELPAGGPQADDVIVVDGAGYRIRSFTTADADGLVWRLDCVPEQG